MMCEPAAPATPASSRTSRVLPMPASPSRATTPVSPPATASSRRRRSASRPKSGVSTSSASPTTAVDAGFESLERPLGDPALEAGDVDPHRAGLERDRVAADDQVIGARPGQRAADEEEGLAEAVASVGLLGVAPQQGGQLFTLAGLA